MINPGNYDIACPQGATYSKSFLVKIATVPWNLTGYTAAMQVRESADADTILLSLTSGSGITLGGTAGTIDLLISATDTAGVPAGSYSYDLELNSGTEVTRLLEGSFNVSGQVTR